MAAMTCLSDAEPKTRVEVLRSVTGTELASRAMNSCGGWDGERSV
jgi:hypothetical protein